MSKIKRPIVYLCLFSIINLSIIGFSHKEPFYSLLAVVYPYDEVVGKYNIIYLTLNICICLIFVSSIIQNTHKQYILSNYILTRTTRKRAFCNGLFHVLKSIAVVFSVKLISDILFSQPNGLNNILNVISAESSMALTLVMWSLVCFILFQLHISMRLIYFAIICMAVISQYLSAYLSVFSLFVFGSPAIKENPIIWLMLKTVLIILLLALNLIVSNRYEHLNVKE